mmetsp:Transcript_23073/g.64173  ORF Transcript_23073/g.64173 Transcript_23073/m.64173 type:complete len:252 (-) Transcript_23073:215-970(-)
MCSILHFIAVVFLLLLLLLFCLRRCLLTKARLYNTVQHRACATFYSFFKFGRRLQGFGPQTVLAFGQIANGFDAQVFPRFARLVRQPLEGGHGSVHQFGQRPRFVRLVQSLVQIQHVVGNMVVVVVTVFGRVVVVHLASPGFFDGLQRGNGAGQVKKLVIRQVGNGVESQIGQLPLVDGSNALQRGDGFLRQFGKAQDFVLFLERVVAIHLHHFQRRCCTTQVASGRKWRWLWKRRGGGGVRRRCRCGQLY